LYIISYHNSSEILPRLMLKYPFFNWTYGHDEIGFYGV
jgi:hypothetical protein